MVLASGNGSNLQAIIDRVHGRPPAPGAPVVEIALVVSDQPGVPALDRARQADIPTEVCALASAGTREAQEAAILDAVRKAAPDLVVLAGYMRIVPPEFVRAFPWRIINLHPALLPGFSGHHLHQATLWSTGSKSPASPCTSWTRGWIPAR